MGGALSPEAEQLTSIGVTVTGVGALVTAINNEKDRNEGKEVYMQDGRKVAAPE